MYESPDKNWIVTIVDLFRFSWACMNCGFCEKQVNVRGVDGKTWRYTIQDKWVIFTSNLISKANV